MFFVLGVSLLVLGGGMSVYFCLGGLFLIYKFSRVLYILLVLEYFSLVVMYFGFYSSSELSFSSAILFFIVSSLVLEASMGVGLLVSLVRWESKASLVSG